jgi:hypothetical protein
MCRNFALSIHSLGHTCFQHLPDQRVGHVVAMAFDFNVIVDVGLY